MAITVSTMQTLALKRYGDMNDGATLVLDLLQQTWDFLLSHHRLVQDSENVSLAAEDPEYDLTATILRIWAADYVRSATEGDSKTLTCRSIRWMDAYRRGWRDHGSGEPSIYMVDGGLAGARSLRLYRKPDTTTVSSYPNVRLQLTRKQTLVASAPTAGQISSFPEFITDPFVLLEGAWERYAELYAPQNNVGPDGHSQKFIRKRAELDAMLKLYTGEDVPVVTPGWAQMAAPTA